MEKGLGKLEEIYLLKLARKSIAGYLQNPGKPASLPRPVPPKLLQPGASFVTLHERGRLRGCVGSLEAFRSLAQDVAENSLNAAFEDSRFPPLEEEELPLVKISISVLTAPKPLAARDARELLGKLVPKKTGLTIRKGGACATFLPQVWEELPGKEDFLSHLCLKAGLTADEWRQTGLMKFETYEALEFGE